MRKRNCDRWFDNIFWYTLYFLPVILFIAIFFSIYHDTGILPSFSEVVDYVFAGSNGVANGSNIQFSMASVLEYFYEGNYAGNFVDFFAVMCCGHFVLVYLFHLFTDFLLFIPRLCHKWLKDFTQGE